MRVCKKDILVWLMENARCSKSLRNNRIPYSTDVRPSNQVTKIRTKRFIPNEVFPRDLWIGLIKVTTAWMREMILETQPGNLGSWVGNWELAQVLGKKLVTVCNSLILGSEKKSKPVEIMFQKCPYSGCCRSSKVNCTPWQVSFPQPSELFWANSQLS